MKICLNCGRECGELLCETCNENINKENLIMRIYSYTPGKGNNEIWDRIAEKMSGKYNFRALAAALAEGLRSPRKEYMIFRYIHKTSGNYFIHKDSKKWFYDNADILLGEGISDEEKVLVYVAYLYCLYTDHRYPEAEKIAELIYKKGEFTYSEAYYLADYFMRTRRYEIAEELLENAILDCDGRYVSKLEKLRYDAKQRQLGKENGGRSGYAPTSPDDKAKYFEFMKKLGINVDSQVSAKSGGHRRPADRIARSDYPDLPRYRDSGFKSFVAYDIETTGLSTNFDNIIEIGAVRVKDGVVIDKFQTLVHPMDRRITEEAQKISGITNEDVKDAPDNKTAFNAFADFIGNDILVGFNNHRFDDKLIVRSGRYAYRIISNKSFDTMVYARNFKDKLTFTDDKISLESCCKQLSVKNEKAHRALSDAEATAQIYLKLLQMDNGSKASLDDIISDDDWA